jgi:hypothetical protein
LKLEIVKEQGPDWLSFTLVIEIVSAQTICSQAIVFFEEINKRIKHDTRPRNCAQNRRIGCLSSERNSYCKGRDIERHTWDTTGTRGDHDGHEIPEPERKCRGTSPRGCE